MRMQRVNPHKFLAIATVLWVVSVLPPKDSFGHWLPLIAGGMYFALGVMAFLLGDKE